MELRHIRYFLAVAEHLSFTRAAKQLGIAQPPLSQQVKVLETEIGTQVFRRLSHGVELNDAGEAFLQQVKHIPGQIEEAIRLSRKAAAGEQGVIRLGFTGTAAINPAVPDCIRQFRQRYPDIEIQITEANSVALSSALAEGRLDVAILRPSKADPESLSEEILSEEPLLVALPASHPLARSAEIRLHDLQHDPFILTPRNVAVSLHDAVLAACAEAGFIPLLGPAAPHIASILSLVAADLGVSLVPRSIRQVQMEGMVLLPCDSQHTVTIAVAYRKGTTSPLTRNFLTVFRRSRIRR